MLALAVEQQNWQDLEGKLDRDTIKDQAVRGQPGQLTFQDVIIPRIGTEFRLNENFSFTGGVAYSESPLESNASVDVNYLDTDKWIIGLGVTAKYKKTRFLAFPVRFDLAYQHQILEDRTFDIYDTQSAVYPQPSEQVEASGDVNVISGSITLKF